MKPRQPAICLLCKHLEPDRGHWYWPSHPACRAFPEGIPDEILLGGFDHRKPHRPGERFLFEPADWVSEVDIASWERVVLERQKQDMLAVIQEFKSFENEPWDD